MHSINVVAPLTASGSNSITIDTLWKPSMVTVGTGLQTTASDANGTLQLDLTGTESRSQLKLIDSQSVVRSLVPKCYGRSYVQLIYPGRPDVFEFKLFYYGLCEYISCRKTANANYWRRYLPQWSHRKQLYS